MMVSAMALALVALAFAASVPNVGASWTSSWNYEVSMGDPVSQATVFGSPEGIVYVMGGVTAVPYTALTSAYAYDTETGSWTSLNPLPAATRGAAGAMGLDGRVYVFGGYVGGPLEYTQIYDPDADLWTLGELMPYPVWEAKAATLGNGSICVVGGEDVPGLVQIYDPAANTWSIGPPVPEYVMCGAMVSIGDDLYYSGGGSDGYAATTNLFKYDSALGAWTTLADLLEPRAGHAMVEGVDGLLYILGGADDGSNLPAPVYDSVYAYDIEADEWSEATSMDVARTYLGAAATSDGRIWALGGNSASTVYTEVESLQLYLFDYSVELSSSSVRAGESVLLMADAEFVYVEESGSELRWSLVSADDGTVYASEYVWNSMPSPMALTIDVSAVAPAGDYLVVIEYWYVYADVTYEYVTDLELELEVLPAADPADLLIADLEEQIAALEEQLSELNDSMAASDAALMADIAALEDALAALEASVDTDNLALMDEIAALQDQITALQTALDEANQDVGDVQTSVDDKMSAVMGYAIIGLLVVVVLLLIVMMVMGRKSAPPPAP